MYFDHSGSRIGSFVCPEISFQPARISSADVDNGIHGRCVSTGIGTMKAPLAFQLDGVYLGFELLCDLGACGIRPIVESRL